MLALPEALVIASLILGVALVWSAYLIARVLATKNRPAMPLFPSFPSFPPLPPLPPQALPVEPSGIPVGPDTRLEEGTPVLANWRDIWWRARVVALESADRVRIHYEGWDDTWDETVPRSALQIDISESARGGK
jgi:hypothetical protein